MFAKKEQKKKATRQKKKPGDARSPEKTTLRPWERLGWRKPVPLAGEEKAHGKSSLKPSRKGRRTPREGQEREREQQGGRVEVKAARKRLPVQCRSGGQTDREKKSEQYQEKGVVSIKGTWTNRKG